MLTFLQPVDVPERCFLKEVLYWVAFQRLPTVIWLDEGEDIRDSEEIGGYVVEITDSVLDEREAARLGLPNDPKWRWWNEGRSSLPVSFYDNALARNDLEEENRKELEAGREFAIELEREKQSWLADYQCAIEYPASRIFIALRSGSLRARGRLLPGNSVEAARSKVEASKGGIFDIPVTDIPPTFWSLKGIDFDASAAGNGTKYYCHVSCSTDDLLSSFPAEGEEVTGVRWVGDSFVLSESSGAVRRAASSRGRPPYPWDAFHLEVTTMLRDNKLPEKKEAAIEHFRCWFQSEHGIKASRSVMGEKLKPYYDRFVRAGGQKIR
jgi:hypothetical protein